MPNPAYPRFKNPTGRYVVDASRQLFIDKGYELTTLADIADQLGVTKAAIYHWFRTKEQILGRIVGPFLDSVDELLGQFSSKTAATLGRGERVRLCRRFLELLAAHTPDSALFMIPSIRRQPMVEERVTRQGDRLRELLGPEIRVSSLPAVFDAARPWLAPDVDVREYVDLIPQVADAVVDGTEQSRPTVCGESSEPDQHVAAAGPAQRRESAHR